MLLNAFLQLTTFDFCMVLLNNVSKYLPLSLHSSVYTSWACNDDRASEAVGSVSQSAMDLHDWTANEGKCFALLLGCHSQRLSWRAITLMKVIQCYYRILYGSFDLYACHKHNEKMKINFWTVSVVFWKKMVTGFLLRIALSMYCLSGSFYTVCYLRV